MKLVVLSQMCIAKFNNKHNWSPGSHLHTKTKRETSYTIRISRR